MIFELTAEQDSWSGRARDFSLAIVAERAKEIDDLGVISNEIRDALAARSLGNPFTDGAVAASIAIEEIAAVSAGAAAAIGLEWTGAVKTEDRSTKQESLPGLRGSALGADRSSHPKGERAQLVLCAVAIGVGRAAIAVAVQAMKSRGIKASGDETTPHWTLADAAAELAAARLLVLSAAQAVERSEAAEASLSMAARLSTTAAEGAVAAASLVVGVEGYRSGSPLERFTRDARTLTLLLAQAFDKPEGLSPRVG